jgi:hypothetical protein
MKPEKKTTETMKTTPATMPTQAATVVARLWRGGSAAAGGGAAGGGAAVSTGPVAGSEDDVVSLMNPSMQAVPVRLT